MHPDDLLRCLTELFISYGVSVYRRPDNGPEFTNGAVRNWLTRVGARPLYIEPGSSRENGYVESFNGKLRDELLDGEIFYTLREAQVLTEAWRRTDSLIRPTARSAIAHLHLKR